MKKLKRELVRKVWLSPKRRPEDFSNEPRESLPLCYYSIYGAQKRQERGVFAQPLRGLPSETVQAIVVVLLFIFGLFLVLAAFDAGGAAGSDVYKLFRSLLGVGYFLLPALAFTLAGNALREESAGFTPFKIAGSVLFIVTGLGFLDLVFGGGGILGYTLALSTPKTFNSLICLVISCLILSVLHLAYPYTISFTPFCYISYYYGITLFLFVNKKVYIITFASFDKKVPCTPCKCNINHK